jgi:hypothetical protein
MGIIVDLIIVAVLALFIIMGYKKGLTGSLIKLLSFVIAIVLAFVLYKPLANAIIENTQIDENIKTSIIQTLNNQKEEDTEKEQSEEKSSNLLESITQNIKEETENAKNEIIEKTAQETTITIINIGSGIAIFLIARALLVLVNIFAKQITKLPLIKQVDKIGGIAYGVIEGMIIIYAVLAIISLTSLMWENNTVVTAVVKSTIGNALYTNNLILNLFL